MIQNLVKNWRTTSLGITTIAGSIIHLSFAIHAGTATEGVWNASVLGIVVGIGLILSGDGATAVAAHEETKVALDDLQKKVNLVPVAIQTGDTSIFQKANDTSSAITSSPNAVANPPKIT